jgi:hypothetical protein
VLFVLLAARIPIGFAMGWRPSWGPFCLINARSTLELLGQTAYETALTYNRSVVPMFVLMGYIAGGAGLSEARFIVHVMLGSALAVAVWRWRPSVAAARSGDMRIEPCDRSDDGPDRIAGNTLIQLR